MLLPRQQLLFETHDPTHGVSNSSTFVANMKLPVHRWFRFSAGFSAQWAEFVIAKSLETNADVRVFDPFAGSATTLIAAEDVGVPSWGVEAHPFLCRISKAKLARRSDADDYRAFAKGVLKSAKVRKRAPEEYPPLIRKCYRDDVIADLDRLRRAFEERSDGSAASELTWLTLVSILRKTSHVNTASWQYVLPSKTKHNPAEPFSAFQEQIALVYRDMLYSQDAPGAPARFVESDARTSDGVSDDCANLIVTSPPYPNNYDYADATRLEMTFMREIQGWGDLQESVRQYLVRSCSQHVPEKTVNLQDVLGLPELEPIREEISTVCQQLAEVRLGKGGRKTYHLMVACYFLDLGKVWRALRRVSDSPSKVCFVVGDSAPYGVYVPVIEWLAQLAVAAGFHSFHFEKIRDRNVKWKNRKHRVPLCEGRLWVHG